MSKGSSSEAFEVVNTDKGTVSKPITKPSKAKLSLESLKAIISEYMPESKEDLFILSELKEHKKDKEYLSSISSDFYKVDDIMKRLSEKQNTLTENSSNKLMGLLKSAQNNQGEERNNSEVA